MSKHTTSLKFDHPFFSQRFFNSENELISAFTLKSSETQVVSGFTLIHCVQVSWGNFKPKFFMTFGPPLILVKLHSIAWFLPYLGRYMWHLQLPYHCAAVQVSYARRRWQMEMWKWSLLKLPFRREMLQMSLKCNCHKDGIYIYAYLYMNYDWIMDVSEKEIKWNGRHQIDLQPNRKPSYIVLCNFDLRRICEGSSWDSAIVSPLGIF